MERPPPADFTTSVLSDSAKCSSFHRLEPHHASPARVICSWVSRSLIWFWESKLVFVFPYDLLFNSRVCLPCHRAAVFQDLLCQVLFLSAPTSVDSPHPYDRGALGQSFLKPVLPLLPHLCFLSFGHSLEGISELASSRPNLRSSQDWWFSGLDVYHRQGDWLMAGLRKTTFVTNFTKKFKVKISFPSLLALEY